MFDFNQCSVFISSGDSFSSQNNDGEILQLSRVQSFSAGFQSNNQDISSINEDTSQVILNYPPIGASVSYIATNGYNERSLGFTTDLVRSAFTKLNESKNLYITQQLDFKDSNSYSSYDRVLAIGNAYLNNYSVSASVRDFVRAQASFEAFNICVLTGSANQQLPAVNSNGSRSNDLFTLPSGQTFYNILSSNPANNILALSYKDLILTFPSGAVFGTDITGANSCFLQNFDLNISIPRQENISFGNKYPSSKNIIYPVDVALNCQAVLSTLTKESLNDLCEYPPLNIDISVKQPCSDFLALQYNLYGMKLESQEFSQGINEKCLVNWTWRGKMGPIQNTGSNLYIKAYQGTEIFILDEVNVINGEDVDGDFYFEEESIWSRQLFENLL